MNSDLILYHGTSSDFTLPTFAKGKATNDFGRGFYTTADLETAKEWACRREKGFVNKYTLQLEGLKILDLTAESPMKWLAVLANNRWLSPHGTVPHHSKKYVVKEFGVDLREFDVIKGWRADNAYFRAAMYFLSGTTSFEVFKKALSLDKNGVQYCVKSRKAFSALRFDERIDVPFEEYHNKYILRDEELLKGYFKADSQLDIHNDLLIFAVVQEGFKNDNPRLQ